ncbi:MAG: hypothetical protein ACOY90_02495 [Candidatus Zhuqueibacterota bacterium]
MNFVSKTSLLLFVLVGLFLTSCMHTQVKPIKLFSSSKAGYDEAGYSTDPFWRTELGNDSESIKSIEKGKISENTDSKIVYNTKFLGLTGDASYYFKNDLLIKKEFKITISNSDETKIKSKFNEMKKVVKTVEDYMDSKTEYVRGKIDTHEGELGNSGLSGGVKVYNYKNTEYTMSFGFIVVGKFSVLSFSIGTK